MPEGAQGGEDILCEKRGAAGVVTLNRPKVLNALNRGMIRRLHAALDEWERDEAVTRVIVQGAGERAFCAGGDVRHMHDLGRSGRLDEAFTFWAEEYRLNARIKRYRKPYISLLDGIVMGGGVGLSVHGSVSVAGERLVWAMPEVAIGFFPDVGAAYPLSRLPGETGTYLALTGERIGTADALALGIVTHSVPSAALPEIREALAAGAPIEQALGAFARPPGASPLSAERVTIDAAFAAESVRAILGRLDAAAATGSAFAATTAATMRSRSPTSMAIALEQIRRARTLNFEDVMRLDFRIVRRVAEGHDFYEGVRAALVDKDQRPRWQPASVADVAPAAVSACFEPLPDGDLTL